MASTSTRGLCSGCQGRTGISLVPSPHLLHKKLLEEAEL